MLGARDCFDDCCCCIDEPLSSRTSQSPVDEVGDDVDVDDVDVDVDDDVRENTARRNCIAAQVVRRTNILSRMFASTLLLLAVAATAATATATNTVHSAVSADPCASIQANTLVSVPAALACLDSIPFDLNRRDATIEMLLRGMELYTFVDIAAQPPAPFDAVDLVQELGAIVVQNITYSSDLRMHIAIADIFRKLGDAHTRYRPPACYLKFNFYNAFSLFGFGGKVTGKPILGVVDPIGVAEGLSPRDHNFEAVIAAMDAQYGAGWSKRVADATVLLIDGLDAWDQLFAFANSSVGVAKSAETRAFLSLTKFFPDSTSLGWWTKRNFNWNGLPPASVNFTLLERGAMKPTTYVSPFYMASPYDIISSQLLLQDCYSPSSVGAKASKASNATAAANKATAAELDASTGSPFVARVPRSATAAPGPAGFRQVYTDGQFVTFWVGKTNAGVLSLAMFLPTFEIPDATSASTFANSIRRGFEIGAALGATQLIIDLTANGGGNICAGIALLNATNLFVSEIYSDMPGSSLANAMATALENTTDSAWSAAAYDSAATGLPFTNASWLVPGVMRKRGGRKRAYSQYLHLSEQSCGANFPFPPLTQFNASSVRIVTHGECGSTCALFTNHASRYAHVRTAVVGVHNPSNQQVTSFPGLQVLEDSEIYASIAEANLSGPFVPVHVPGGSWRACIREIYGHSDHDTPLEYRWQPADQAILPDSFDAKVFGSYWKQL
jgi:hypothetical protein